MVWLVFAAVDRRRGGIEVPHGPAVDALMDRGFVLHAINPKQLNRLCDRLAWPAPIGNFHLKQHRDTDRSASSDSLSFQRPLQAINQGGGLGWP